MPRRHVLPGAVCGARAVRGEQLAAGGRRKVTARLPVPAGVPYQQQCLARARRALSAPSTPTSIETTARPAPPAPSTRNKPPTTRPPASRAAPTPRRRRARATRRRARATSALRASPAGCACRARRANSAATRRSIYAKSAPRTPTMPSFLWLALGHVLHALPTPPRPTAPDLEARWTVSADPASGPLPTPMMQAQSSVRSAAPGASSRPTMPLPAASVQRAPTLQPPPLQLPPVSGALPAPSPPVWQAALANCVLQTHGKTSGPATPHASPAHATPATLAAW